MSTDGPILVCYDGSDNARRAVEIAADLFHGRKAIVLHVWSPVAVIASAYGAMVALRASSDRELQEAALKVSDEGVALASEAGLQASPECAECTFDGTSHAILGVVDEYEASVIVLGARGLSTFKSFVLGSVSHGVTQHAHRPVLVVPPTVRADRAEAPADQATAGATG
jgi:nucleotide-binding universal stress UspA family protein